MDFRSCHKCGNDKPISEFYKAQITECKECTKIRVRNNRRRNADYYREYDRKRGNRQGVDYLRDYRTRNPEKYKAHCALNNALRDGKINKEPCFMCGTGKSEAHHPDYSKPLDVIWLCSGCHSLIHSYEDRVNEIRNTDNEQAQRLERSGSHTNRLLSCNLQGIEDGRQNRN